MNQLQPLAGIRPKPNWLIFLALFGLLLALTPAEAAPEVVNTITDTTFTTATNNGTIAGGEYVGSSTGINSGFGNVIGSGSQLYFDSSGSGGLNIGLAKGAGAYNDAMVIYIDSVAGGFNTTNTFNDTADACRRSISGYDGSNRSRLNFATGFNADYAICMDTSFAGLWQLAGTGSHTFVTSVNRTNAGSHYEMNLTLANLGLANGGSFNYVATYLNPSNTFRSDEFHGVASFGGGNPGYTTVTLAAGDFNTFNSWDTTPTVDRTDDTNAAAAQVCSDAVANDCSLRGAISRANADSLAAIHNITIPAATYNLSLAGANEEANATGDLDITRSVNLAGAATRTTIINANDLDRVLHIPGSVTVSLSDLTLTNGNVTGSGGGINNNGTLSLSRSAITSSNTNGGGGDGGGLWNNNSASVTINNSTISGNTSGEEGGGIFTNGTVIINNSTVSGNSAIDGGGITISFNGSLTATTTTISDNTAIITTGVLIEGTFNFSHTIIANGSPELNFDCDQVSGFGAINDNGYNIVENDTGDCLSAGTSFSADPGLGSLTNNGGPTDTHALSATSTARDTGNNATCAASPIFNQDQRGIYRPIDGDNNGTATCDIGAFEYFHLQGSTADTSGNGPGGVGLTNATTSLAIWLKGDAGAYTNTGCTTAASNGNATACWQDQSGYARHATQTTAGNRPVYTTATLNGFPVLRFTAASSHYLNGTRTAYSGTTQTVCVVATRSAAPAGTSSAAFWLNTQANDFDNVPSFTFAWENLGAQIQSYRNGGPLSTHTNPGLSTPYQFCTAFSGTTNTAYLNGSAAASVASTGNFGWDRYRVGARQVGGVSSSYYPGDIAELIVYDANLTSPQRILMENYLSAKYNISLNTSGGATDIYDGDTAGNGDFDRNVAGIGRTGGVSHGFARAAGMVISNTTFLVDNGDWLLFGHRSATNQNVDTDLPSGGEWDGVNDTRWNRHWYIDVTDAAGTTGGRVDIVFDYSDADVAPAYYPDGPATNYRLLKRTGSSGQFSDITSTAGAEVFLAGDQVWFRNVDVNQLGSNFTLGTLDNTDSPTALTLPSLYSSLLSPRFTLFALLSSFLALLLLSTTLLLRRRPQP